VARRSRHSAPYFGPSAAPITEADASWAISKADATASTRWPSAPGFGRIGHGQFTPLPHNPRRPHGSLVTATDHTGAERCSAIELPPSTTRYWPVM
jgi:hypothetical protein